MDHGGVAMLQLRGPSGEGRAGVKWPVWRYGVDGEDGVGCVANMVEVGWRLEEEVGTSGFRGSGSVGEVCCGFAESGSIDGWDGVVWMERRDPLE